MDDVETGYYLELKGGPEMSRKYTSNQSDETFNNGNSGEFGRNHSDASEHLNRSTESDDNELHSGPINRTNRSSSSFSTGSDQFLDSVNEMYGLDRGKSKFYKEVFKLYTHRQDEYASDGIVTDSFDTYGTGRYGSFETGTFKRKVLLWLMILVLVSNPMLGGYNLYHFSNYPLQFSSLSPSQLNNSLNALTNVANLNNTKNSVNLSDLSKTNSSKGLVDYEADGQNEFTRGKTPFKGFKWFTSPFGYSKTPVSKGGNCLSSSDGSSSDNSSDNRNTSSSKKDKDLKNGKKSKNKQELENGLKEAKNKLKKDLLIVSEFVGRKVSRYCFFEIFGELIFGLFSLVLLSLCRLPCNSNSNSVRFLLPSLFMFYMIIYRFLACYILLTSFKIIFYSILAYNPSWTNRLPSLFVYTLSFKKLNLKDNLYLLRNIYELDKLNVRLLLIFALQNVYITFSESLEIFSFFFKVFISFIRRKILKKSDLNFYSSNETGFKLFKKCFNRDTFSSSDPHEKYIHSLYNYASDIGTYLKNIEIAEYTKGLDDLANKFKNRKLGSPNY